MELVPSAQYLYQSRISPRCFQCPSRQRIENIHRFKRLENTTTNNSTLPQGQGNRFVCNQIDKPTTSVCKLASRSTRMCHGCVYNRLEYHKGICIPPIQSHSPNIIEGEERQCNSAPSSTNLAGPILVATLTSPNNTSTSLPSFIPNSSRRSIEPKTHSSNVPKTSISRMDHLQQRCMAEGLLKAVTQLLSSATRQSTNKAYDSAWGKWNSWCVRRKINPISTNIKDVLVFLSNQFENKLRYRTINVIRSAISSVHPWIDGKPVGQHPLVMCLMKGIANERPPKPRYTSTWDISTVTSYITSLGDNNLCLKLLTKNS